MNQSLEIDVGQPQSNTELRRQPSLGNPTITVDDFQHAEDAPICELHVIVLQRWWKMIRHEKNAVRNLSGCNDGCWGYSRDATALSLTGNRGSPCS